MNSEQAKMLLQSYRSGDQDKEDPRFAEALLLAEKDPELKQWFEDQRAFDAAMASHVQAVAVPSDLKRKILTKAPQPVRVWRWPVFRWRPALAGAVGLLLLAGGAGIWWKSRPPLFHKFSAELAAESWSLPGHVPFECTNLVQARTWLKAHNAETDFTVPAVLQKTRLRGCGVVEWRGQNVPMLCLLEGKFHMHLLVTENVVIAKGPGENDPRVDTAGYFNTASWKVNDKTYLLAGMPLRAFVQKFRHTGRWNWDG